MSARSTIAPWTPLTSGKWLPQPTALLPPHPSRRSPTANYNAMGHDERSAPKDARSLRETITADQGNRGCRAQPWEARYVRAENGSQVEGGSTEGAHGRTRPDASPIEQTKATPT